MAVAVNADLYAAPRVGIFFPAHNNTPSDGNLTGQCVTLVKWFMGEMSQVPQPFMARGHARYVGQTLVRQGHAVEVPWSDRRRGDIVCMEYGEYGHIYVQLSDGKVFEENVNVGGVASRIVDGERVYAARIGHENESFRIGKNSHVYRLNTYKEGNEMSPTVQTPDEAAELIRGVLKREPAPGEIDSMLNRYWKERIVYLRTSEAGQTVQAQVDMYPKHVAEIALLKKALEEAGGNYEAVTEQLYRKKK